MNLPEAIPKRNGGILDRILAATRQRVARRLETSRQEVERRAAAAVPVPSFADALRAAPGMAVIAEVKRRSPSAGVINGELDPVATAGSYREGGAAAISVLTEPDFFGGSLDDLTAVVASVNVPALRKDFILDPFQLLEAKGAGASAALLIARVLDDRTLRLLLEEAMGLGLDILVETHSREEVDRSLAAGAAIIGVNSRDLDDFRIDRTAAWELLTTIPADRIAVAESGMESADDVREAARFGADAVLVGGAAARSPDPALLVAAMAGVQRIGR